MSFMFYSCSNIMKPMSEIKCCFGIRNQENWVRRVRKASHRRSVQNKQKWSKEKIIWKLDSLFLLSLFLSFLFLKKLLASILSFLIYTSYLDLKNINIYSEVLLMPFSLTRFFLPDSLLYNDFSGFQFFRIYKLQFLSTLRRFFSQKRRRHIIPNIFYLFFSYLLSLIPMLDFIFIFILILIYNVLM